MKILENKTKNQTLVTDLTVAGGFWNRNKGLLGRKHLGVQEGLWIEHCNSIHTFFMNFPIDVAFVDSNLVVCAAYNGIPPWRLTFPKWKAKSVFELPQGTLTKTSTEIGDQLNVVHAHT